MPHGEGLGWDQEDLGSFVPILCHTLAMKTYQNLEGERESEGKGEGEMGVASEA